MKTKKIKVVLTAYVKTSYEDYTHKFKTVEIEIPDDGENWHVAGEVWEKSEVEEDGRTDS